MKLTIMLCALVLSSCATTKIIYVKQTTPEQAQTDHDECLLESVQHDDIWPVIDRTHFENCLEERGYRPAVVPND